MFSNTNHPILVKWVLGIIYALAVVSMLLWLFSFIQGKNDSDWTISTGFLILLSGILNSNYLSTLTIDLEAGTVIVSRYKNCPIRLSELVSITYKKRILDFNNISLVLHDNDIRFVDFYTNKEIADQIVEKLLELNPSIEVKR